MQTIHEKPDDLHPVMNTFGDSALGKIIQKANYLLALDRAMQTILPSEFVNHCHVMNINQSVVILGVNSAAIATRIQLMSSDIISALQNIREFQGLLRIHCKVQVR
jgi:hypothetical protein